MSEQNVDIVLRGRDISQEAFQGVQGSLSNLGTTVGQVLGTVRNAWSQMGGTQALKGLAEDAGKLADLSSQTGVSIEALQRLGFAAEQSGSSMEKIARAASTMGKTLAGGSDSTKAAIEALGLSFDELRGMKPEDALLKIGDALGPMEDKFKQTQIAAQLFGKAGIELLPTLSSNMREVGASATVMTEQTVTALDDAGDRIDAAKANLQAQLGNLLGSVVAAVGPDVVALGAMFGTVASTIAPLIPAIATLWPSLVGLAGTIGTALVPALGLLLSPIGLVVAAVVGLGLIWYKWGDDIKAVVSAVYTTVKEYLWDKFEAIVGAIAGILTTIKGYWDGFMGGVTAVVTETAATTKTFLVDKFETVKSGVSSALTTVKGYWDAHNAAVGTVLGLIVGKVSEWIGDLTEWLGPKLRSIFEATKAIITLIYTYHVEMARMVIEKVSDLFRQLTDYFGAKLRAIVTAVKTIIDPIVTFFTSVKDRAIAAAEQLYTGVKQWLVDRFDAIVAGIKSKIDAVTGFFKDMYDKVVGSSYVVDLVEGIGDWFGRLQEYMVQPAEEATGAVASAFNELNSDVNLRELGRNFAQTLDDMRIEAGGWKDKVLDIWGEVRDGISERIGDVKRTFEQALTDMLLGQTSFKEGMKAIWDAIKEAVVSTVVSMIANILSEYIKAIGIIVSPPRPGGGGGGGIITPPPPPPPPTGGDRGGSFAVFGAAAARTFSVSGASVQAPVVIPAQLIVNGRVLAEVAYDRLPSLLQARGVLT